MRGFSNSDFNPQMAYMQKKIYKLEKENRSLKKVVAMLSAKISNLETKTRNSNLDFSVIDMLQSCYPFLAAHLCSVIRNSRSSHGNSFPSEFEHVYIEFAQVGEASWNLFVKYFGFPSFRTVQRYRSQCLCQKGISIDLLDGSFEHIKCLIQMFISSFNERMILAIDAAAVSPKITIHKNGFVEGFLSEIRLSKDSVSMIKGSLTTFHAFVNANKEDIIKDFFVVYACPIESRCGGFPLALIPKNNGSASIEIISKTEEIYLICKQLGIEMQGMAFDGDTGWLKYVKYFTNLFHDMDFTKNLVECIARDQDVPLPFEDVLHLIKCLRYRIVCGSNICPFPDNDVAITSDELLKYDVPAWVLDPSQYKKMDDFLPFMLFNKNIVTKAIEKCNYGVVLTLLPATLMLQSVFDRELNRGERLINLSICYAIFYVYHVCYENQKKNKMNLKQTFSMKKGENDHMKLYDINFLDKAMSLCYSLSTIICDGRQVHLGALGTYWLEHFFGNVRRKCQNNDSSSSFMRSITNSILLKAIRADEEKEPKNKHRSDSGVFLQEMSDWEGFELEPIGCFIRSAFDMFITFGSSFNEEQIHNLMPFLPTFDIKNEQFFMVINSFRTRDQKFDFPLSTRALRVTFSSGFSLQEKHIESNQI